ncbi:hypothetical protein PRIPAC_91343 [Pristionchus pacificus]|uniref:Uncharacterized protein n=1 Tax=Pristionchus pacificus TaxID=54126 RepID=A0A2A6CVD8_PRIPA|nr:hypothetical protein PRIPAC_91343 [Pristionchus pacificus]|eukprot:PDM82145.1 hypothetical protein PRIPAC_36538 [Pristionchus pacificus]
MAESRRTMRGNESENKAIDDVLSHEVDHPAAKVLTCVVKSKLTKQPSCVGPLLTVDHLSR